MRILILKLSLLIICLSGCTGKQTNSSSFYIWKSKLTVQDADAAYLDKLETKKLYIRMFDVDDKGNGALPLADYSPTELPALTQEGVPVIFITNRTFLRCAANHIDSLARKCIDRMDALYHLNFRKFPSAYQFDCDWTEKSHENYFRFLESVKMLRKQAEISCTIRLHQIKFRNKTGVPSVDKGVLMYYASSEPTDFTSQNTILDNKEASLYIEKLNSYPLHLDIALPLYSWGIVRNPFNQIKLINGVCEADIHAHPEYYLKQSEGIYRILQSHYLRGTWINKGYELKVEEVGTETLQEAARLLKKKLKKEDREIIFYHLDKDILHRYSTEQLNHILNSFS